MLLLNDIPDSKEVWRRAPRVQSKTRHAGGRTVTPVCSGIGNLALALAMARLPAAIVQEPARVQPRKESTLSVGLPVVPGGQCLELQLQGGGHASKP